MGGSTSSSANPSGVQGACPDGWHLPSDAEWTTLTDYLGGTSVAGGKMKATGTTGAGTGLWNGTNVGATNASGFSGLPGGYRTSIGTFYGIGSTGHWWSSTEGDTNIAWYRSLNDDYSSVGRGRSDKDYGFSVRCVRD
jgi:uncharacterized protein (TIGR02145 family)